MEPLKPQQRAGIRGASPAAAPTDIDEYERLLAEQFVEDPDVPAAPAITTLRDQREARLQELHRRLFGSTSSPGDQEP